MPWILPLWRFHRKLSLSLRRAWRTYGTRVQNGARKYSLTTQHLMLPQLFLFILPSKRLYFVKYVCVCVCIHMSCRVQIVHELLLLPNNTANETFLHKPWAVRGVDWIFNTGVPAWRWLGEYVTLVKTSYSLLFKQVVAAAPFTSKFFFFLIAFLDQDFVRNAA